jgi:hypothetical protein
MQAYASVILDVEGVHVVQKEPVRHLQHYESASAPFSYEEIVLLGSLFYPFDGQIKPPGLLSRPRFFGLEEFRNCDTSRPRLSKKVIQVS